MEESLENKISSLQEEYFRLTGLRCHWLPADKLEEEMMQPSLVTDFCVGIARERLGHSLCAKRRKNIIKRILTQSRPMQSLCHANFTEIALPVKNVETLLGVLFCCVLTQKNLANIHRQQELLCHKYQMEPSCLNSCLQDSPLLEDKKLEPAIELLFSLVKLEFGGDEQPLSTAGITPEAYEDALYEFEENPTYQVPIGEQAQQLRSTTEGYRYVYDLDQQVINEMYMNIKSSQLIQAKERFKSLISKKIWDGELDPARVAVMITMCKIYENFMRHQSYHSQMQLTMAELLRSINQAQSTADLKDTTNDFFIELVDIYSIDASNANAIVGRIKDYIEANYMYPISLLEFVDKQRVSASYVTREFKKQMGITPKEYLNEVRMFQAQHLLRYTDLPVAEIAKNVGYQNVRSFYKMFDKYFDVTCSQMRGTATIEKAKISG